MYRFLLLILTFLFVSHFVKAQESPFNYSVEFKTLAATKGELPFWLHANRWGTVDPSGANAITSVELSKTFFRQSDQWSLEAGAEVVGRYSSNPSAFFKQLYAKLDYRIFRLEAGRFEDITGNVYKPLSMGSMSFSGNATPLPKIKLSIPEYQPVPLTKGYLEIRGAWGHGWMEEERYTSNALLIEQYGYARLGGDLPINIIGGLHHFAFWGGNSPTFGSLPQSFNDYIKVALALGGGGEDAPVGDQQYFLGDHKGYWDFGAEINLTPVKINLYKQFFLEDKDNVKLKSPQDGLYGVSVENKDGKLVESFLWEFLYTKWQNGPVFDVGEDGRGGKGGRDDYYNHFIYRSGWTYFGNTIGTPLLFPRNNGQGVANNRVVAHHWGIKGEVSAIFDYQLMGTYSRNYGTYDNPFPRVDGYSLFASMKYDLEAWQNISFSTSLAGDFGQLQERNLGVLFGFTWNN